MSPELYYVRKSIWKMRPQKIYIDGEICWTLPLGKWIEARSLVRDAQRFYDPRIEAAGYQSFRTCSIYWDVNKNPAVQYRVVHVCADGGIRT